MGTEGHANTDLMGSLTHAMRCHGVQAGSGEDDCKERENEKEIARQSPDPFDIVKDLRHRPHSIQWEVAIDLLHLLSQQSHERVQRQVAADQEVRVSHVLEAMEVPEEWARGTIRLSTGRNTTTEEVRAAAAAIAKAATQLRGK